MHKHIPYQLHIAVTQIDPQLDQAWELSLQKIFLQLDEEMREIIYKQILQVKEIQWNKVHNTFSYHPRTEFFDTIDQIGHDGIRNLAKKVFSSLSELDKYKNALEIADFLEIILRQIDKIDVNENLNLQKIKQKIRKGFIYKAANIILKKETIEIPFNQRNITTEQLKSFFNEVFLKQQLLGYWFKTLRPYQLAEQPKALFNTYLKQQQQIRQLEIVKTSKFIFILAPTASQQSNPFSARRFLQEDIIETASQHIYLNGIILDLTLLDNEQHIQQFKSQMQRIISIEKQISKPISDLISHFEEYNSQMLLPFLFQPFDATGLNIESIIRERLLEFEQRLSINILEPLAKYLRSNNLHQDECNYLFISIKQIMSDIISYFYDFQNQPAVIFDEQVNNFSARLQAYLTLLKKRSTHIFKISSTEEWYIEHENALEPIQKLKQIGKQNLQAYLDTSKQIKTLQRKQDEGNYGFMERLFNKNKKIEENIRQLKNKIDLIKESAFIEILRIPKEYSNLSVYLEFEALISINNKERHYAFPTGDNGISRLPILIKLPENRKEFNLQEFINAAEYDLSLHKQEWAAFNR
ncbi:hypothetical protein F4V57_07650 [Acinetobacter qingfengensis]|uniref:Uncharacterized protein n=2 Tax=Acinetobacter qingfengensis TaxID=1262585 RepID=A0A1E7RA92_9GAMM|nr:hypothetical protein [Acinetobacter qingfengensis]KAA8733914.1 hypothetical protein F4V57_07650 [Acinetobacter qingfengensis]OEY96167.1 hypothetical protein BJI46_12375 [Acinetobacter qingfengensis]